MNDKTIDMTDQTRRDVLDAVLPDIPFDGWTISTIEAAGERVGIASEQLWILFPDGPVGVIEFFFAETNRKMAEQLALRSGVDSSADASLSQKIKDALRVRIVLNQPNREAVRRAIALLLLPRHGVRWARLLAEAADAIWHAVGDQSTDFSYYSKRAVLSGVYGSVVLYWLGDQSEDQQETLGFIDRCVAGVLGFGKRKADFTARMRTGPSFFRTLGTWRYGTGSSNYGSRRSRAGRF